MVDISKLKMIVNVVEKDIRLVTVGDSGTVDVDAYPGEKFHGRIARVAPVLDPATRTASMEIEIANNDKRLKPGMYARVSLTVEERKNTLVAPKSAVVDFENKRGVWMPNKDNRAAFVQVRRNFGIEDTERIEITGGLNEGDRIVTTGATAVRNNDQLIIAGATAPGAGGPGGASGRGGRGGAGAPAGAGGQKPQAMGGPPAAPASESGGQRPPRQ